MNPDKVLCVIPSKLGVGEKFAIKLKLKGESREIPCSHFAWDIRQPKLLGAFNLCPGRGIKYMDDTLPEWQGILHVEAEDGLSGRTELEFDGVAQGVFPGDTRPIKTFGGFSWTTPGFHFVRITDPVTGHEFLSNPVYVTEEKPAHRLFWGDPHWQTIITDGIRSPEELYSFARDEAFLDFGAISDHMEGVSDRQWDYFQAVTNDYNQPGVFATLIGQEWTNHKYGHRNIYYRGDGGPLISSRDANSDTLEKLWTAADAVAATGEQVLLIPHHPANVKMGCDWSMGWNPKYEKVIEIYSSWGSSECHADDGNSRPLKSCNGEMKGRHVRDALNLGYRFGFVAGGDIHDGRPGDCLNGHPFYNDLYPSGLTAVMVSELSRETVFDAIRDQRTYAATCSRIYLDVNLCEKHMEIRCASEHGLKAVDIIKNGMVSQSLPLNPDSRSLESELDNTVLSDDEYIYVRVTTKSGDIAWSSPFYIGE